MFAPENKEGMFVAFGAVANIVGAGAIDGALMSGPLFTCWFLILVLILKFAHPKFIHFLILVSLLIPAPDFRLVTNLKKKTCLMIFTWRRCCV